MADLVDSKLASDFLKSLQPTQVGAALSQLVAASIGNLVMVFSRSPSHKHYSFADVEWMVMPAVSAGQFYIVEATDKTSGFRAPIAAVTWAFVSEEVDRLLQTQAVPLRRLRPDQWTGGTIAWLIDAAGDAEGIRAALRWLASGPFKEQPIKLITRDASGTTTVTTLEASLAEREAKTPTS
ncbi:toxin-activating lysine-acyltransferase [Mesorhizobium sp. IMUNJ 23033]|uniref:toxin-activating lysine-acyltransferase n=1 Tax=Mesorhizobium sp. IMUNJ 23033 TaxID=3378039 RepID=UPI00384E6125